MLLLNFCNFSTSASHLFCVSVSGQLMEPSSSPPLSGLTYALLWSGQERWGGSGLPAKAQLLVNINLMNTSVCRILAALLQRQQASQIRGNRRLWIIFLLPVMGEPSKELSKDQLTCQNSTWLAKCPLPSSIYLHNRLFPLSSYFHLLSAFQVRMTDSRRGLKGTVMKCLCVANSELRPREEREVAKGTV